MHNRLRKLRILPFLIFFCKTMTAVSWGFVHYDISNGLSDNSVQALIQDTRGYMWIGTKNGLNRFDGYTFKTYRHVPGDSATLGSNYIFSLFEDKEHRLWVGTTQGIYMYQPQTEEFRQFDIATEDGFKITGFISSIAEDKDGRIWIATLGQGVFSYLPEQKQLIRYHKNASQEKHFFHSDNIYYLYIDKKGTVWITPQDMGIPLSYFDKNLQKFIAFDIKADNFLLNTLTAYTITEDDKGFLWLGTWSNGLCRLDLRSGELKTFLLPGTPNAALHIHSLLRYDDNTLFVGSDDGLQSFNTETGESKHISLTNYSDNKLSDRFIYPIYRDREGGIWIGTYFGGLNYTPLPKGNIQKHLHSDHDNSVSGNVISCFYEDEKGNIWIGSDDGGLSYLDTASGKFTNFMPVLGKNSISYHNIHALYSDNNKLWIGTYSGGLNVLDLETMLFKQYQPQSEEHSLDNNSIYSLYKDSENVLWIGTMNGIVTYNPVQDNFIRKKTLEATTLDILDDKQRNVWFATSGKGLFQFRQDTEEWIQHLADIQLSGTIPSNNINCLCLDANNCMWVGTENGLAWYEAENNIFHIVPLSIPSSFICDIVADGEILWLTTTNGLVCYNKNTQSVRIYFKSDGMQSDQYTTKAALMTSSGKIYLGTTHGFNVLDPHSFIDNTYAPPVYITNLQIFNKDIEINSDGILKHSIELTDTIELSFKQNVFSIEYAALSYASPLRNEYRYKLEGFDNEWNIVGNQRKATYTNLPAGKYIFRVTASNNDGIWNKDGSSLHIIIHPPFWRTNLAYLFYLICFFMLMGYVVIAIRKRSEKKHAFRLQQMESEKEKEMHDAKINFFTVVAHEIRTPVSLIIGPLEKIKDGKVPVPPPLMDDLKIIDKNSQRLLSLVNQLLDFRKVEKGSFKITFTPLLIYDLLQNIYERFNPLMVQNGFVFELDMEEKTIEADVDAEAFTKIISNLLSNAAKHAKAKIVLSCFRQNSQLVVKVTDDGEGIRKEEKAQIFQAFYQIPYNKKRGTGIGLSLVKQLTEAHHGTIEVESIPNIFTSFILTLPLHQTETVEIKKQTDIHIDSISDIDIPFSERSAKSIPLNHQSLPTLLIVEDNQEMRSFLSQNFENEYTVLVAKDGQEGLNILKKRLVDLIISDLIMPEMDGITFSQKLKNNILYSHIPFILLTAKTDVDSKVLGIKAGADIYVEKPFSLKVLNAQVENLLASRKALWKTFTEMPLTPLNSIAGNKADEQFLNKMNRIIEKNISNMDFSIDTLAEELNVSRSTLFSKIKILADMTPNELIHLIRLKKAAELLLTQTYRVNEICYMVGFNNPSYFSRCFLKQFGILPKDFAK